VLIFLLITAPAALAGQQSPSPSCGLIGTWRFVEIVDWDSAGHRLLYYGPHPGGYLIYTPTGQVSVHITSGTRSPAETSRGPQASYFGTFTTDPGCRIVTHQVEGGTVPEYTGTAQPRPFRLSGDSLILGDDRTWRRVLIRVRPAPPASP
jgi:hypothetical protein